jgi:hypothetical protein
MGPSTVLSDLRLPEQFDAMGELIARADVARRTRISADPNQHVRWLEAFLPLGFAEINLHNVCCEEQERFIDVFGARVATAQALIS